MLIIYSQKAKNFLKKYDILLFLVIIAFFIRCIFIFRPFDDILLYLEDDAYYYFVIAKNIIEGEGVVFNHGAITNGFHPLYLWLITPIFWIFSPIDSILPIYIILMMLSIFDIGTGIILYFLGQKLLNKKAGIFASAFWLLNPFIIQTSLLGLESSIQTFFIALLTYYFIIKKDKEKFSLKESITIAVLISITIYSRLDGLFILIGIIISLILKKIKYLKKNSPDFKFFKMFKLIKDKDLIIITIIPCFFTILWVIWSFINVGIFTPISGTVSNPNFFSEKYFRSAFSSINIAMAHFVNLFYYPSGLFSLQIIILFIVYGIPLTYFFYKLLFKNDAFFKDLLKSLNFILIGIFFHFGFYWFLLQRYRPWYAHFQSYIVCLFFPIILIYLIENFKKNLNQPNNLRIKIKKRIYPIIIVTFIGILSVNGILVWNYPFGKRNPPRMEAARYINENIPEYEIIGSFNTGILQFFTPNHDIINLDGYINPEAFFAKKNNELEEYIIEKNISWIIDPIKRVENFILLNVTLITTFRYECNYFYFQKWVSEIHLFKIEPL